MLLNGEPADARHNQECQNGDDVKRVQTDLREVSNAPKISMLIEIKKLLMDSPGLRGREIAKRIGKNKRDVNSFVHAHPDDFIQDNNYCWSLKEMKVEFESNKWIDCESFEICIKKDGSPLDLKCTSVVFVIPEDCKILLNAAARFLALCNQLIHKGKAVTIDFSDFPSTLDYFNRIGFLDHLDDKVRVLPGRPLVSKATIYRGNSDAVVEFGSVSPQKPDEELAKQLTDRFIGQSNIRYQLVAFTVFSELIGNICEHSQTPLPGFAALQKYGGQRKHVQTVVSDSGLGIVKTLEPSLKEYYPDLYKLHEKEDFHEELVTTVLTKGGISRFGSGRGLGFKSSRKQAVKFKAELSVRQENFSLKFSCKRGKTILIDKQTDLATIRGTHICFDFFVD